jgi:hypothetical protein
MATEATLNDVIERLRAEGQLTRNTGTNSIRAVKIELSTQTAVMKSILETMQIQEERMKRSEQLGRAALDSNGDRADRGRTDLDDITEDSGNRRETSTLAGGLAGGLAGALAGLFRPALQILRNSIRPLLSPIQSLARLLRIGGPVAIAVGLLWEVFKDIGENENFVIAIEAVKEVWNEKILPLFNRLRGLFDDFMDSESTTNVIGELGKAYRRFITSTQNFISNTIRIVTEITGGIIDGLNTILDGDYVDGIFKIFQSLLYGMVRMIDNAATEILRIFGIEFGEDGTFFSWVAAKVQELWNWTTDIFGNMIDTISNQWNLVTGGITNIGSYIWSQLRGVWNWLESLFTNPTEALQQLWDTALGEESSLAGLFFLPIDMVVRWVRDKFGWSEENAPAFSMRQIVDEWVDNLRLWVTEIFSFLPSADDISQLLIKSLPEWLLRLMGYEPRDITQEETIRNQIGRLETERLSMIMSAGEFGQTADTTRIDSELSGLRLSLEPTSNTTGSQSFNPSSIQTPSNLPILDESQFDLNPFRTGTQGFMDFGLGTPSMLHGIEAVVPRGTPAGEFLAQNFDENWQPVIQRIANVETAALQQAQSPTIIVNAPTVAPVNNNVTGPTNISNQRVTALGTGSDGVGLGRFAQ